MDKKKIFAFSSSKAGQSEYLENALPLLKEYLNHHPLQIAFIPFASVGGYEEYGQKVARAISSLEHSVNIVSEINAHEVIAQSDAIMVGGGNTFKLLADLYRIDLLTLIKEKVQNGTAYIGWSAGSNILGKSIGTTNDMPIAMPPDFAALGLFPFNINPHYQNIIIPEFNGETRDDRLAEFLKYNPTQKVIALPEGSALLMRNGKISYHGELIGYQLTWNSESGTLEKTSISDSDIL